MCGGVVVEEGAGDQAGGPGRVSRAHRDWSHSHPGLNMWPQPQSLATAAEPGPSLVSTQDAPHTPRIPALSSQGLRFPPGPAHRPPGPWWVWPSSFSRFRASCYSGGREQGKGWEKAKEAGFSG